MRWQSVAFFLTMIIGAAALAVRGVARSTYDVDVLVVDRRVLEASWWDALRADDPEVGPPTQMAVFARVGGTDA